MWDHEGWASTERNTRSTLQHRRWTPLDRPVESMRGHFTENMQEAVSESVSQFSIKSIRPKKQIDAPGCWSTPNHQPTGVNELYGQNVHTKMTFRMMKADTEHWRQTILTEGPDLRWSHEKIADDG